MEQVLCRPVDVIGREDNAAAFLALQRGYSRKLAHLARTVKLSSSALHERYSGDPDEVGEMKQHEINSLVREPTETQRADIYTKPLGPARHWECVAALRMGFLEAVQDYGPELHAQGSPDNEYAPNK